MEFFSGFALEVGAITHEECEDLRRRCWTALEEVAAAQQTHHRASDPVVRFLELLGSALSSGHAHLAAPNGLEPAGPGAWGWRRQTPPLGPDAWRAQGDRIGWLSGDDLYLDPNASHRVAQKLGGSDALPVTTRTLNKRLDEKGYLRTTDPSRQTLTVRRMLEGRRRDVLHLHVSVLTHEKPDQPDQPPPAETEEADSGQVSGSGSDASGSEPDHRPDQQPDRETAVCGVRTQGVRSDGRVGQVSEGEGTHEDRPNETTECADDWGAIE